MLVRSNSWDHERVPGSDQVLEIRCVSARLHVARKGRRHDERDPPIAPYGQARATTSVITNENYA